MGLFFKGLFFNATQQQYCLQFVMKPTRVYIMHRHYTNNASLKCRNMIFLF